MAAIRTTEGWVPNPATERIMSRVRFEDFVQDIDWEDARRRFAGPPIPEYVRSSIHGIAGGYGQKAAAETWDAVVSEIFQEYLGAEQDYRDRLPAAIGTGPATVLDVACGTGESTLAWRRRFPDARVAAFDVSPYMVAVAERKLAGQPGVTLRCADAERIPEPDDSFDVVTASLLFHELPDEAATQVLAEMHRVCAPGGEIAVMEPYQVGGRTLKPIPFPEPYLKEFLARDWDQAFAAAGFTGVCATPTGEGWIRVARKG